MFGAEAAGIVILLVIALIASVVVSLILGIIALVLRIKGKRKAAYWFCSPVALLAMAWAGLFWYLGPTSGVPRDVKFTVKPNEKFPHYRGWRTRIDPLKATRHLVKGDLTLDITLPDGKKVTGTSRDVVVYEMTNGIAAIAVYYQPEPGSDQFFDYWSEGGKVLAGGPFKGFAVVQRDGYEVEVSPTQGGGSQIYIRFPPGRSLPWPVGSANERPGLRANPPVSKSSE